MPFALHFRRKKDSAGPSYLVYTSGRIFVCSRINRFPLYEQSVLCWVYFSPAAQCVYDYAKTTTIPVSCGDLTSARLELMTNRLDMMDLSGDFQGLLPEPLGSARSTQNDGVQSGETLRAGEPGGAAAWPSSKGAAGPAWSADRRMK